MTLPSAPSEAQRAYFYRLALAVLAGLVVAGIVSADDLPTWANIVAAVFAIAPTALATANTSTKG